MNIYTVRDNLIRTIEGKEQYLAGLKEELANEYVGSVARGNTGSIIAVETTAKFLEVNIGELKRILADVEVCCVQATEASWIGVDRQGGI